MVEGLAYKAAKTINTVVWGIAACAGIVLMTSDQMLFGGALTVASLLLYSWINSFIDNNVGLAPPRAKI